MRTVTQRLEIAGSAHTSAIVCQVAEADAATNLHIEIDVDRDCVVGCDGEIYRRELRELIDKTLAIYFRTA